MPDIWFPPGEPAVLRDAKRHLGEQGTDVPRYRAAGEARPAVGHARAGGSRSVRPHRNEPRWRDIRWVDFTSDTTRDTDGDNFPPPEPRPPQNLRARARGEAGLSGYRPGLAWFRRTAAPSPRRSPGRDPGAGATLHPRAGGGLGRAASRRHPLRAKRDPGFGADAARPGAADATAGGSRACGCAIAAFARCSGRAAGSGFAAHPRSVTS